MNPLTHITNRTRPRKLADRIILSSRAPIGLVIGTYGASPYIHLQMETRQRNYPGVPILVHDDASAAPEGLRQLCRRYGADFSANPERFGHSVGDLSAFLQGLYWARTHGIEILVKFSRRLIPMVNWVPDLQALAWETQYATYCNRGGGELYFRSECVAMHVSSWFASGAVEVLAAQIARRETYLVEFYTQNLARQVHRTVRCIVNEAYEEAHPKDETVAAYGDWAFLGTNRSERQPQLLWRHSSEASDYFQLARSYGLMEYALADFEEVSSQYVGY